MSEYVGIKAGALHEHTELSEYYCARCGCPVTDHDSYCRECGGAFQRSFATEPCDREALLAMIEEMVETFRLGAFTGEGLDAKWCRELYDKYAHRIRETLGVEDYAGHNDEPA